jgi:tetratricopeptide (TPR) repeat protein
LHQIGRVSGQIHQYEQAERAYRQSLAINVQQKDLASEARSLGELGNLYDDMGRLEEAVKCYRQAVDIDVKQKDQRHEGIVRNNLAGTLLKLHRYDEARRELDLAIECKEPYGHVSQLWKCWIILCILEQATGNLQAAAQARQKAIESYLAYRRDGGQSMTTGAQLCTYTTRAIEQGNTSELEQILAKLLGADVLPSAQLLISKLQAILRGDRNPTLADDTNLYYQNAVELRLLLEGLGAK